MAGYKYQIKIHIRKKFGCFSGKATHSPSRRALLASTRTPPLSRLAIPIAPRFSTTCARPCLSAHSSAGKSTTRCIANSRPQARRFPRPRPQAVRLDQRRLRIHRPVQTPHSAAMSLRCCSTSKNRFRQSRLIELPSPFAFTNTAPPTALRFLLAKTTLHQRSTGP